MQLFALPGFSRLRTGGLCSAVDAHTPTFHVHPQLSTAKFKNYLLVAKRLTLAFLAFPLAFLLDFYILLFVCGRLARLPPLP